MRKTIYAGASLFALLTATGSAGAQNEIYVTVSPVAPNTPPTVPFLLLDGNINGSFSDPTVDVGYLEGPELAVFDWLDAQGSDCQGSHSMCADISVSDDHHTAAGLTRPHWGTSTKGMAAATTYYLFQDAIRNYFDVYSTVSTNIGEVANSDKLVVMLNRPESVGCSGSCMRPWVGDTSSAYQIFRSVRPDGRNEGTSYNQHPKIFLGPGHDNQVRIPIHEYGHYYNRVFVPLYGNGGGFDRRGSWEEKSLDEGLGYWYVSDYADTYFLGRWDPANPAWPVYSLYSEEPEDEEAAGYDEHHLGDVITSALWHGQDLSGCDPDLWSTSVFALVDSEPGGSFFLSDPYNTSSALRGFAWDMLQELFASGACTDSEVRRASHVFRAHELFPPFVDQRDSGATNEAFDSFGRVVAAGDFNADGFDDLVVGAPGESEQGEAATGMVHIFYGATEGIVAGGFNPIARLNQSSQGSQLESGDAFGSSVAVGDFNADGYDDLAVGVPYEDLDGEDDAGYVHIFYGGAGGFQAAFQKFSQTSVGSTNEEDDRFAYALASGDFNNDGYADLAIGGPGEDLAGGDDAGFLWVVSGSPSGLNLPGAIRLQQESMGSSSEDGDGFGTALGVGDFNGDGYDDLAVGAPFEDTEGGDDAGFVFLLYGKESGLFPVAYEKFSQSVMGSESEDGDYFGDAFTAGDFDADGYDDLVIGAPGETLSGEAHAGFLFLMYGSPAGVIGGRYSKWDQEAGGSTNEQNDYFAAALSAGDLNGDGYDDLQVGIPGETLDGNSAAGFVHLYFGDSSGINPANVFRAGQDAFASYTDAGDLYGNSLALGDFNGDGGLELAIGAPGKERQGEDNSGAVYIAGGADVPLGHDVLVFALAEGLQDLNISRPRIYVQNQGTTVLRDFKVYYYFVVSEGRVPLLEDWYTPYSTVSIEPRGGNLYRLVYDYTGFQLSSGQIAPDACGTVVGLHFADWSPWDKSDDPSHAELDGTFKQVSSIAVEDAQGNLLAGRHFF